MKKFTSLLLATVLCCSLAPSASPVFAQERGNQDPPGRNKPTGKIIDSYDQNRGGARPTWVDDALRRSLTHLKQNKEKFKLDDVDAELKLKSALKDDFGQTHVRLD